MPTAFILTPFLPHLPLPSILPWQTRLSLGRQDYNTMNKLLPRSQCSKVNKKKTKLPNCFFCLGIREHLTFLQACPEFYPPPPSPWPLLSQPITVVFKNRSIAQDSTMNKNHPLQKVLGTLCIFQCSICIPCAFPSAIVSSFMRIAGPNNT